MSFQPGILAAVPAAGRYLFFRRRAGGGLASVLRGLAARALDDDVIGIGSLVVQECGGEVPGLRELPSLAGPGVCSPSTPGALWCWLRGDDRGALLQRGREITRALEPAFAIDGIVDAFRYAGGRDLTGYEDGTENPKGEKAEHAAFVTGAGAGLDGSSFVAVQVWQHELDRFEAQSPEERDHAVGRRHSDNEEIEDAPSSAHVKRTAQESFSPEAFVLRRSMPWSDPSGEGLVFVAFGRTLDAFEAQLRRMVGLDDGITDALFRFTRPLTGSTFWCPPVAENRLDLSALKL